MAFRKRQSCRDGEHISGFQGLETPTGCLKEFSVGIRQFLILTVKVVIQIYTCGKIHRTVQQ